MMIDVIDEASKLFLNDLTSPGLREDIANQVFFTPLTHVSFYSLKNLSGKATSHV